MSEKDLPTSTQFTVDEILPWWRRLTRWEDVRVLADRGNIAVVNKEGARVPRLPAP